MSNRSNITCQRMKTFIIEAANVFSIFVLHMTGDFLINFVTVFLLQNKRELLRETNKRRHQPFFNI